jgi:pantoate--beta-alanine ligase
MQIISHPLVLKNKIQELKSLGKIIAFVPTMGALHEGHLSLIRKAQKHNTIVVVSIFVNPLQFNQKEDFEKYPNQQVEDIQLLEAENCDLLFLPSVETIYNKETVFGFELGAINQCFEGSLRPGHFNGVAIVVAKLFNMVQPDLAYFGKKDLQQLAVIKQLVFDLSFPIEIIGCETLRAASGLALSSRNQRLSEISKQNASIIYKVLSEIKTEILKTNVIPNFSKYQKHIESAGFSVEYLALVHSTSFKEVEQLEVNIEYALVFAGVIDKVRLIDNVLFIL